MTTTKTNADAETLSSLAEQKAILMDAMFAPHGVASGLKVLEKNLAKAVEANPHEAPFPLVGEQATLWHRATAEAYRHALEMVFIGRTAAALAPATSRG